ncbi:unnamed protein product [Taenia asiatica]|uniref:Sulphotransf domain-containing protein n=1 Tax=Taenia asiatica TaxID=60517 RepID=A0A0R3W378_TAEAS|nr:unnamed protein product [Taenia asiatica]
MNPMLEHFEQNPPCSHRQSPISITFFPPRRVGSTFTLNFYGFATDNGLKSLSRKNKPNPPPSPSLNRGVAMMLEHFDAIR